MDCSGAKKKHVLILGIYLSDHRNSIDHIVRELGVSSEWQVSQKWCAIGRNPAAETVERVTVMKVQEGTPKFVLLNRLLSQERLDHYDFVLVCDDDIGLQPGFLDTYFNLVEQYDFALAQPARTHSSFIDHHFVEQLDGLRARRTRFVEIGPVFSVRRDAFPLVLPFDESSPMGWGYDFVWPCLMERSGLRMGIVDATSVEHCMRKPVTNYSYDEARKSMEDYLSRNPHLSKGEAFRIVESYA